MVAWQDPQILALDEVIGTDRTREVTTIGSSVGIRLGGSCSGLFGDGVCSARQFSLARSRLPDIGVAIRRMRRMLAGGILGIGHFNVPLGGIDAVGIAEFDDGDGVEHGLRYTSCSTLPWPASDSAGPVPLGMTVSTDGAGDNDAQEEGRDDTRDAVQDNHRCEK